MDAPAGVTQEEGHEGFLHLPSAAFALTFIATRVQPSLSLDDREVEFCVPTTNRSRLVGIFYFILGKIPFLTFYVKNIIIDGCCCLRKI